MYRTTHHLLPSAGRFCPVIDGTEFVSNAAAVMGSREANFRVG
jgi:hypothetical protein